MAFSELGSLKVKIAIFSSGRVSVIVVIGMNKRIIFFDADDTLFSVTPSVAFHYREVFAAHGHTQVTEPQLHIAHQRTWDELKDTYENREGNYRTSPKRDRDFWREYSRRIVERCINQSADVQLLDSFYDRFALGETRKLSPGIYELLESLSKDKSIILGVFSNNDARINSILSFHKIDTFFQYILTAESIGIKKPSTDVFKEINQITRSKPEDSIYVGDSLFLDVLPARSAGWRAHLYDPEGNHLTHEREATTHFLHELQGNRFQ